MKQTDDNGEARERVALILAHVAEVEAATADSYSPRIRAEWACIATRGVARHAGALVFNPPLDAGLVLSNN